MPWRETWVMDEKVRFVAAASEEEAVMSELCVEFGISRQTGYKWLQRYRAEGLEGLKDRSRAPNRHGRAREEELVAAALGLRERQPTWGPKKLRRKLSERWPDLSTPAISTIGDWLRKEGLTQSRRPRRRCPPFASPFQAVEAPNAVWCADFKGWFRTGEGKRCDPLTISDAMSRYLLRCEAVAQPDGDCVRDAFDAAFCEFGLPLARATRGGASNAITPTRRCSVAALDECGGRGQRPSATASTLRRSRFGDSWGSVTCPPFERPDLGEFGRCCKSGGERPPPMSRRSCGASANSSLLTSAMTLDIDTAAWTRRNIWR